MFGEGFDLPQLKVAAMHDIHKSLPITLQFVGRFTRTSKDVGPAAVVINVADPQVDKELQALYAQDADWNDLLRRSSESKIAKEMALQELVQSFHGSLPSQLPLWNLRPGFSTLVYRTSAATWSPAGFAGALPSSGKAWTAVSDDKRIVVAAVAKSDDVRWGRYRDIKDLTWHLIIAFWDEPLGLLFLYASDYQSFKCDEIARSIVSGSIEAFSGPNLFRVFHNIERPMVRTLGASKTGTIRYTMYFGPDVSAGLSEIEKAESELNNMFAWGYEQGDRITMGCAIRKGKVWAHMGGPISDWRDWCHATGTKLNNGAIDPATINKGFLKPVELQKHPERVPVAVDWGEIILNDQEDRIAIFFGDKEYPLSETGLHLLSHSESSPMRFAFVAGSHRSEYEFNFADKAAGGAKCEYLLLSGPAIEIRRGSGERKSIAEWAQRDPLVFYYADGSFSYNQFFVDAACPGQLPRERLTSLEWTGIDIRKESQGPQRDSDTVQAKMVSTLLDDFEVVFNDDGSGEAADIIALRQEGDGRVLLRFVHCKFSSEPAPGSRVADFYELCGQAQKCIHWKHAGMRELVAHMRSRDEKWAGAGSSRFLKGDLPGLRKLEKRSRLSRVIFEVAIVQPGLSKSQVSPQILDLLGSTELFLKKTVDARFDAYCSV